MIDELKMVNPAVSPEGLFEKTNPIYKRAE